MAARGYNFISEIADRTQADFRLKTRVTRKWITLEDKSYKIVSLDLLLMDETGAQIHVRTTSPQTITRLKNEVLEHGVYFVTKFSPLLATATTRPIPTNYVAFLKDDCVFDPVLFGIQNFPRPRYNFIPFSALASQDAHILVDAIGILTDWPQTKLATGSNPVEYREISLVNERGDKLSVILWGDFKDIFSEDSLRARALSMPIVVINMGKIYNFNGIKMGTTATTRIFLNPEIPEATYLRRSGINIPLRIAGPNECQTTLSDVLEYARNGVEQSSFRCIATITKVMADDSWYYLACQICKTRVHEMLPTYQCKNHGVVDKIVLLCKLSFQITDDTGVTLKLVTFKASGEASLGPRWFEIIRMQETRDAFMKSIFKRIEGKKTIFNIKVIPRSIRQAGFVSDPTLPVTKRPTESPPEGKKRKME